VATAWLRFLGCLEETCDEPGVCADNLDGYRIASFIAVPSPAGFRLNELLPLPQSAAPVAARDAPVASSIE